MLSSLCLLFPFLRSSPSPLTSYFLPIRISLPSPPSLFTPGLSPPLPRARVLATLPKLHNKVVVMQLVNAPAPSQLQRRLGFFICPAQEGSSCTIPCLIFPKLLPRTSAYSRRSRKGVGVYGLRSVYPASRAPLHVADDVTSLEVARRPKGVGKGGEVRL